MTSVIEPAALLLIIALGFTLKRMHIFGKMDYRVVQAIEFDLVIPGAIVFSFATNPHHSDLLWISVFSLVASLLPPMLIFLTSQKQPVANRVFLMLNASGFSIGCFCFPVLQSLIGPAAMVPAAMFDIENNIMVAAGTNVLTQTLLHIQPDRSLAEQHPTSSPIMPYHKTKDPDARRLQRLTLAKTVCKSFLGSPAFDTYLLMVLLMVVGLQLPTWVATVSQPFSEANAFCAMLMVGMIMEFPAGSSDLHEILEVLAWRVPCAIVFALAAWFLLPFSLQVREAVALCCLAPTAVFSTMFTDKVLGNGRLAGFLLALTTIISLIAMVSVHMMIGIL